MWPDLPQTLPQPGVLWSGSNGPPESPQEKQRRGRSAAKATPRTSCTQDSALPERRQGQPVFSNKLWKLPPASEHPDLAVTTATELQRPDHGTLPQLEGASHTGQAGAATASHPRQIFHTVTSTGKEQGSARHVLGKGTAHGACLRG